MIEIALLISSWLGVLRFGKTQAGVVGGTVVRGATVTKRDSRQCSNYCNSHAKLMKT